MAITNCVIFRVSIFRFVEMTKQAKIITGIQRLNNLSKNSPYVYNTTVDLLVQAFSDPKPLFDTNQERTEAAKVLCVALPKIESSLNTFQGSLNSDLRQTAQRLRSGLQFLVDELKEEAPYKEIEPILSCSAVKLVELYIENTKGISPEFSTPEHIDLSSIPPSHFWWKDSDTDED